MSSGACVCVYLYCILTLSSNGDLDPWSGGGVLESISDSLVAVIIKDGAHHLDLRASNPADTQSVKEGRQIHCDNISKWLSHF